MATTSLSSQLLQLATPQTSILDHKRDRRSILFDPSEAAKFGRDVYYDIGWSGYEVLAVTDPVFQSFGSSLFGRSSRDLQRAVETKEVNTKLDVEIEKFLLLLSPYLEKEASLRALEWLVYRFQINEMNQQSLLKCIFPYYESPLFTRILQVIALGGEGSEWHWLTGCQKVGRPLPKRTVFTRWANSQAFRNFLADFLKSMIKVRTGQRIPALVASFYISTVLGGIGMTEVREEHLSSIVKSMTHCLASGQEQLLSGCYLLLSNLSSKTHLSLTLTSSLMEVLIQKHPPPPILLKQCILCLLVLAHHQPMKELAPLTAVSLRGSTLLGGLAQVAKERSVAALLSPYVFGYVRYLIGELQETHRGKEKTIAEFTKFLDELFSLPLSDSDAGQVIWSLYEAVRIHLVTLQSTPRLLAAVGAAVRAVEAVHPHGFTEATTRLGQQQDTEENRKVLQSLLLPASGSATYFTQLVSPQKAIREEGSKMYLIRLDKGEEQVGAATVLHICSMLSDDHPAIPLMALSTPAALAAVPPAILAEQCCQLLSKSGKEWQKVREGSLAALSGNIAAHYDSNTKQMVLCSCLPYVLLPRTSSDLALAKIVLKSHLSEQIAFLSALKREASPYISSGGKARDYSDKIWRAMPRVVSGLGATELLSLCAVSDGSRERSAEARMMTLALLHASLSTQGAKGHLGVKMAHKLIDLCLTMLEGAKVTTEPSAQLKNKDNASDSQALSPDQLRVYLAQVRQGHLPLCLLTACVQRVCAAFTLPPPCAHTPYWTPMMEKEPGEGHLLLLMKVMKAALKLEGASNTPGRDAVLATVFKECLPDHKFRFYFLAVIWGWQSSLPFTDIVDETLQAWTLVLAKALLTLSAAQSSSLAWMLSTHQPLLPALLSALTSGEEKVRRGAIEFLRALASVKGGALAADSYVEVIKIILSQAEELVADASQLAVLLGGSGSSIASVCQLKQATQCLLGVVVSAKCHLPPHICAALLYSLTAANDSAILLNLLPLAEFLLDKVEKIKQSKEAQRDAEEGTLDVSSSLCLLYILQRYTPEATEVLETEAGLRVFERAMDIAKACLVVHDNLVAPQSILLQEVLSSKFMTSIKNAVTMSRIWTMLVTRVTSSKDPLEAGRLRHALRHVTLDALVILNHVDDLELTPKVTSLQAAKSKRMKMREPSVTYQQSWEKLQLMLETLTVMKGLQRPWLLVGPLIQWLNLTLTLDLTSTTLLQQQILSTLLHILEKSVEELGEEEVSQRVQVNVEVIVACVRASLSHDTLRRALLILSLCARIAPDAVLHNMMAIFTFMGTSLLRRDDAYSFEVIHHTIESIVPTLIQHQGGSKDQGEGACVDVRLGQVCQVFVDALPDLPHHRRLPLFTQLATTLQPNPNLWLLLALLAKSHVMQGGSRGYKGIGHGGKEGDRVGVEEEEERGALPQVIQFSLMLASQFAATTQVLACVRLMQLVSTLPDDKETSKALQLHHHHQQELQLNDMENQRKEKGRKLKKKHQKQQKECEVKNYEEIKELKMEEVQVIFPSSSHSPRHTFHLKYTVTGLVAHLLASDKFVGKVYEVEEQVLEVKELQALCHQLLEVTLCLLQDVNFACDLHKDKSAGRFFTSLQRKVVEVVERLVTLLPPPSLLHVCQGLLSSHVPLVRCRAAELISAKLQPHLSYFRSEETLELQNTLHMLCSGVANKQEPVDNRQAFLYCLQLLTRHMSHHTAGSPTQPPSPVPILQTVLDTAVNVVCDENEEPRVVTQGLLVVAEAVAALQVAAVGCLSRLMPTLMKILKAITTSATITDAITTTTTTSAAAAITYPAPVATTQLLATLTALQKVIDSLPQLLSPYIEEVIKHVCCIKALEGATKTAGAAAGKESKVVAKLLAIRASLIKKVEPRILVPRLVKAFHSLLSAGNGDMAALHTLVSMVGSLVGEFSPKTLPPHIPKLLALLTDALDLRNLKGDTKEVELVEEAIFSSLSRLLLHLPEQDNISIFTSLISWASPPPTTHADTPTAPARLISFYRFAEHLVSTYQVLFVAAHLAEALLPPTVALLTRLSDVKAPPVFGECKEAEERTCMLLEAMLNTLTEVFKHDSVGFVTPERFELLSAPLTDLLDVEVGVTDVYTKRIHVRLMPCLTWLAVAGGDDSLWRGLASQLLRRLRMEDRPQVVLGALEVFHGLVERLGEDFLRPLLADAIPPISEALESSNQEVESATRALFGKMEDILGDQLRAYLHY